MATPTPDKVGFYYASKYLGTNGTVTERTIGTVANAMQFTVTNLPEPTGAWDGALGYFTETTTTALRGVTFHVRRWDQSAKGPWYPFTVLSSQIGEIGIGETRKKV